MYSLSLHVVQRKRVHCDSWAYSAHPHTVRLPNNDILVIFNQTVRRDFILHPPEDPRYMNFMIRSTDGGNTWSAPRVVPGYTWTGMECSGLTVLGEHHLMLNQWQFTWLPIEEARKRKDQKVIYYPADWMREMLISDELENPEAISGNPDELAPWARTSGCAFVHHSYDDGKTWARTLPIDIDGFSGGYGMRGAVRLGNGTIILPLSDAPNYEKVFIVTSTDGYSWSKPQLIAARNGAFFEEPCPFINGEGNVVVLLRDNGSRSLFAVYSTDYGNTWSRPEALGINGYPADVSRLSDGRFLMVFGRRVEPLGIYALISSDETGLSWNTAEELIIDDSFKNKNLGYPAVVSLGDDRFFVAYYGEDSNGTTCILGAHIEISGLE